jgi:uncharacterized protein YlxW (UPF0749 family)
MVQDQFANDVAVWAIAFAFGSIFTWLSWLTVRHFNYGKPAYEALAGDEMGDGHLEATDDRFTSIEKTQTELADRVDDVERKVDEVDDKTDRNYRLLEKIADKADVDGILFRGGGSNPGDD